MALTKPQLRAQLCAPVKHGRPEKVAGSEIALLPTRTGGPGGDVYKRRSMEFAVASLPEIHQWVVRSMTQKAYAKAWGILGGIRAAASSFGRVSGWVELGMQMGRIDGTLTLTDTKNGEKGALAIEYGRDAYQVEDDYGNKTKVGAMTGKFILHRAFGVKPNSLHGTGGGEIK